MTTFAPLLAAARPDEVAIRDGNAALSWAQLDEQLNRVANAVLAADLGPARRLAVFAHNSVETALAHLGGLLGSASTVPVNYHLTADEVAYILEDSESQMLLLGPETVGTGMAAAASAGVATVIGWRCPPTPGLRSWESWLDAASAGDPPSNVEPRPHMLYTSGTTGRPKGTDLPPTMFAGGATVAEHVELLKDNPLAAFGTHLVVGPMYHTGPLSGARMLATGVPAVILDRFDPEATLAAIQQYRAETSVMVPTHFVRLLALGEELRSRYDVSSLRYVIHTGSACPVDVKQAMLEWWGPVLWEAYGATEVGTTNTIGPDEWMAHRGSVGKAVPPFETLILDDHGHQVLAGTEGRLCFKDRTGRGIVYHNDPEKSAAAHVAPGVFTLGEIGYADADGYVYITDRFSDLVVSGGVNIYPAESEQILIGHPKVADVACIGVPHGDMGEELKALVVPADPEDPPTAGELVSYVRQRLSHYKCPRSIEIVQTLGRNAMGKVNKRRLRAPWWRTPTAPQGNGPQ